ncbi:hypothetical protein BM221_010331 [Beauveria bassiana]|uniref:Uncharacterized protein n=1 Tax=Beauveria bassiana TaxID=176275 RepID=A0A2N6N9A5_BEABA|nr:hypothetical protein BM221_010331 [Beauveria bassiana]
MALWVRPMDAAAIGVWCSGRGNDGGWSGDAGFRLGESEESDETLSDGLDWVCWRCWRRGWGPEDDRKSSEPEPLGRGLRKCPAPRGSTTGSGEPVMGEGVADTQGGGAATGVAKKGACDNDKSLMVRKSVSR